MSEDEVATVLRKLEALQAGYEKLIKSVDSMHSGQTELKAEVAALAVWRSGREQAEHDQIIYRAGQASIVRLACALWKSDIAKFVLALLIAGAGTKIL